MIPRPIVIAHRGASGYFPEHTLAAYRAAVDQGADFIEADLVMTRDGQLIARHDNALSLTTDMALHPEFAARRTVKCIDGENVEGWFSEDFTLAEIGRLRAIERIPALRPANARYDGRFAIPSLRDILQWARRRERRQGRRIGLYLETKHPSYFRSLNLAMEEALVALLQEFGYRDRSDPVFIESFEVGNLRRLQRETALRLCQLLADGRPFDQRAAGSDLSYADMTTPSGLADIAGYAAAIGPDKDHYPLLQAATDAMPEPSALLQAAHCAGLEVHPFTFRSDTPAGAMPIGTPQRNEGNGMRAFEVELARLLQAGIDGFFIDQPDIGVRVRAASLAMYEQRPERPSGI